MVLDLRRLDYINSSGLTAILVTAQRLRARGGALAIAGAHGMAALALETAGIDRLVPMRPSEAAARAALDPELR
jgi:anti-sigma B factor antagonist